MTRFARAKNRQSPRSIWGVVTPQLQWFSAATLGPVCNHSSIAETGAWRDGGHPFLKLQDVFDDAVGELAFHGGV